ncbi:unnamed protein product [Closterium sp. NIES-53]
MRAGQGRAGQGGAAWAVQLYVIEPRRPFFLPCPAARGLHCPTLPCQPHALQPARCPACAALQPARRPCSPRAALWQPACRLFAALLALPCLRHPAAAAAAATATRATAAAGAGGAGPTTNLLSELLPRRCVTGSVEAVALGASGSAAALGASESAAPLGARESAAALGARASPAIGPSSAEALHTFTLDSGTSRCFFRDCTSLTPLAAPVPVSLRVAICTCSRTSRHLATFTRRHGSTLYTLTTASAQVAEAGQVAASSQVSASGQLVASCSCRVLSHQTLLWHHRLGHPSLGLCGMHSCLLVSGLPRSVPPFPRSPALPCLPCVEERQRAAPHSSEFPPTIAPLQTLHLNDWGPAPVGGTDQERYFLLIVDDYTRYTIVFPLRRKADVRDEGVLQSFTLPASPQQNGIAERCVGLIMEVARTSIIHVAAPHFLWPFAVGDASVFRVLGALSLVHDAKASKLSSFTLRFVFLGFPTDAQLWQFYHPRSRRVFSSEDVTFDESVCYYRLYPHASHPVPLAPLFLVLVPPPVDPVPPQGPAPSGVSQVDPPPLVEPLEISSDSSSPAEGGDPAADDTAATRRSPRLETPPGFPPRPSSPPPQPAAVDSGAEIAGAEPEGAETEGEGSGGAATGGAGSWGAANGGADSGGPAHPSGGGAVGDPTGGPGAGQPPQPDLLETLSPQAIRAWIFRRGSPGGGGYGPAGAGAASPGGTAPARDTRGAAGAGGAGATSPGGTAVLEVLEMLLVLEALDWWCCCAGGAGGTAGAGGAGCAGGTGDTGGGGAAGPGGARTRGTGATGACGATGAGGATGARGTGGAGGTIGARGAGTAGASGVAGARDDGGAGGAAGAASAGGAGAVGTALCRPFFYLQPQSSLPPPDLVLRQVLSLSSSTGLLLPLLCSPRDPSQPHLLPGSPLPALAPHTEVTESLIERREPEARASTPIRARRVARPLPPAVPGTYSMALRPSSVPRRVILPEPPTSSLPHVSDPESDLARAASPTVTRLLAIVVTDPDLESAPAFALVTELVAFAARSRLDYVASLVTESDVLQPLHLILHPCCFALRETRMHLTSLPHALTLRRSRGVGFFHTFSPTPKMTTLRVLLHVAAQRDYELHSLDFSTAFLQGSLHEEIWLRCPPGFTGTTLAALGFAPSSADPSLFLCTDNTMSPFYVLVYVLQRFGFQFSSPQPTPLSTGHSLSPPPSDESVEPSGPYPELVGCLICEAEIYAGAMAAQELRWLTYLLTDLGERPRPPPVLYVDNKAMLAVCHEQRLEHITKHIALRYFLARELQQRGQLRLAYVASHANTADVFTKALGSGDHQRLCTALGLVPTLPHLLVA